MNRRDRQAAADLLRLVLEAVERGDLTADGPAAVAMVRRLEGAVLALELQDPRGQSSSSAGGRRGD